MKKSKVINLALMGSLLVSCQDKEPQKNNGLYLRSDTTSGYTQHHYGGFAHFVPFYMWHPYFGTRMGYDSRNISPKSSSYSGVSRGGFGSSGFHSAS
jgi:hypothetical protein